MRAQITINRSGITQASIGKTPPDGGAMARRINGDFQISLHRRASESALINMMRALRAMDHESRMTLHVGRLISEEMSCQEICLQLSLRALGAIERENEGQVMSNLELYNSENAQAAIKSGNLRRLADLSLAGKDAPAALMEVSAAKIKNLVSIRQSRSMRLYYLTQPKEVDWPANLPEIGVPLDEVASSSVSCRWLSILNEAAFAIRAPLFHHGFLRLAPGGMKPFQRIIYPITPHIGKTSNHRILTVAEIVDNDTLVIV